MQRPGYTSVPALAALLGLTFLLLACAATAPAALAPASATPDVPVTDPDVAALVAISEAALRKAQETIPDAVLRQLDVAADGDQLWLRFTDAAATQGILMTVSEEVSPDDWEIGSEWSPLLGHPQTGINLGALRVGPAAVKGAAINHWPGCQIRGSLTLGGEGDNLVWYVFCNLPAGVVGGTVNGRTGEFKPYPGGPAATPRIAP